MRMRTREFSCFSDSDNDEEEEPYSSDSMIDPNYFPDEADISSEHESASENENNVETLETLETAQETTNVGSNLREQDSSESDGSRNSDKPRQPGWGTPEGRHLDFEEDYVESEGIKPEFAAALINESPFSYYATFVDQEIIDIMVTQTNLYATQLVTSAEDVPRGARIHQWTPTSPEEMLKFLGLVGYMGLVNMPTIHHYWSRNRLYRNDVSSVMSRNRFELLMQVWHFTDNQMCPPGDRTYKVHPFIEKMVSKFQNVYTPGKTICIDESLVPFRGRLIFKQYMPLKTHKYGVKIFKLCSEEGYTWNMKIYCGKEQDAGASVPSNVVMTLSECLLDTGRTVVVDNYYTSLDLANKLLDRKTHLVGTLRSNRRGNPKDVTQKKLKRGEMMAQENERGICVMKWRDKRDVLLLSTKHTDSFTEVRSRGGQLKRKPLAVVYYNKGKSSIDLSDQMSSYNSALRKTVKWYRKIAIEVLFGTAMVNAHFLYKKITGVKMSITEFKQKIYEEMLFSRSEGNENVDPEAPIARRNKRKSEHKLDRKEGVAHKIRKYCIGCYKKKQEGEIAKNNVKKVTTFCKDCSDQPHYCIDCFNVNHK